jgi:hypothetical protein
MYTRIMFLFMAALVASNAYCQQTNQQASEQEIARLVASLFHPDSHDKQEVKTAIEQALEKNPKETVKQILLYSDSDQLRKLELAGGLLFEAKLVELAVSYNSQLRRGLVHYLALQNNGELVKEFSHQDKNIHGLAYKLLRFYVDGIKLPSGILIKQPTLPNPREDYIELVSQLGTEIPPPLVEYIFDTYEGSAPLIFESGLSFPRRDKSNDPKRLSMAVHIIETSAWRMANGYREVAQLELAQAEIARLANDGAWYSRRYVVHVLLKYPFLRTPELVKQLHADEHPLVRDRAKFIPFTDR